MSYGASRKSKCTEARELLQRGGRSVGEPPAPELEFGLEFGLEVAALAVGHWARSRLAAILLDMPKISMKPLDSDWSKVSPVS